MALRDLKEIQKRADALSPEEQVQLAKYLLSKAGRSHADSNEPNGDALMRYYGRINFKGDPVGIQRKMRSEWPN